MNYPSFNGQVALVTGASSGVGLAAAQAFAAAGAAVALVDVNADAVTAAADQLTAAGPLEDGAAGNSHISQYSLAGPYLPWYCRAGGR